MNWASVVGHLVKIFAAVFKSMFNLDLVDKLKKSEVTDWGIFLENKKALYFINLKIERCSSNHVDYRNHVLKKKKNKKLPQKITSGSYDPSSPFPAFRTSVLDFTRLLPIPTELRVLVESRSSNWVFELLGKGVSWSLLQMFRENSVDATW